MRGFSDEERIEIRKRMLEIGLDRFSTHGPKKTTISDITDPLGIAQSTFYLFFDSKEALIEEIVQEQREEFMATIERELEAIEDAQDGLETLFHCHATWLEGNQFLQQVFFEERLEEAVRSLPQDVVDENRQMLVQELSGYIEAMRGCDGRVLRDVETITVLGLLSMNAFLVSHRGMFEEYDAGYYRDLKSTMITALARGLTIDSSER